ncbi:hypothetical protein AB1Y20_020202 [Prymnesium parvum]|uniref:Brix domain-containing protein n=1 Tax=Prymnesium parvum TaxID=97485 RepID=A0AB34JWQ9_PRYPA
MANPNPKRNDARAAEKAKPPAPASTSRASTYSQVARRTTHIKKKLLVLSSRGITAAYVELMENLIKLLPHAKKEPKFDKSSPVSEIGEIAEDRGCRFAVYFETRKKKDLYIWMGATEHGPSVKFLVSQIRPLRDMRLTGNCLLGSRPILSFDAQFDSSPQHCVLKQLFIEVFATPKGHPNSKPFHDHVLHFGWAAGKILVRHYQIVPPLHDKKQEDESLVEIGPRFTLTPIKIFSGLFGGETIYSSGDYVTPNAVRSAQKRKRSEKTVSHVQQKEARRERINVKNIDKMPYDPLNKMSIFAE